MTDRHFLSSWITDRLSLSLNPANKIETSRLPALEVCQGGKHDAVAGSSDISIQAFEHSVEANEICEGE